MGSLKKVLESTGIPAQRGVYTGKQKPKAYYTFLLITRDTAASADDKEAVGRELWRVTLFYKGDFEEQLKAAVEALKAAGAYINGVGAESYETDTGYWLVPIDIEILKE